MRRIYESEALHRDDDPHTPSRGGSAGSGRRRGGDRKPWSIDWSAASHALLPTRIRDRAIAVAVETDREVYGPDDPVGIRVRLRNRLPFPIVIRTPTRRRWDWTVGGERRAEGEGYEDAPAEPTLLSFRRAETKTFLRTWHQHFRVAPDRWEPARPGTYEVAAFVDVDEPERRGLYAETEIEIRG